jgi:hypothetical protein
MSRLQTWLILTGVSIFMGLFKLADIETVAAATYFSAFALFLHWLSNADKS